MVLMGRENRDTKRGVCIPVRDTLGDGCAAHGAGTARRAWVDAGAVVPVVAVGRAVLDAGAAGAAGGMRWNAKDVALAVVDVVGVGLAVRDADGIRWTAGVRGAARADDAGRGGGLVVEILGARALLDGLGENVDV